MDQYPIPPAPGAFAWDGHNLPDLLALQKLDANLYRNHRHDPNVNGRAYGGQVLAQTMAAALDTVPLDRMPTVLQAVFLQGVRIDVPLDLKVETLQEGKRFSSRHVRGTQGETSSIDAHCSFQVPLKGPEHQFPEAEPAPPADSLATNYEVFATWKDRFAGTSINIVPKPAIDMRFIDPAHELFPPFSNPRVRFWLRFKNRLSDDPRIHALALTYLSDYWMNYGAVAPHMATFKPGTAIYIASLNHSVWFHAPCRADEWLQVVTEGTRAGNGRALSKALVYDERGTLVASVTQEYLLSV